MSRPESRSSDRSRRRMRRVRVSAFTVIVSLLGAPAALAQGQATETLRKMNESVQTLIKNVAPSVVQILVTGYGAVEEGERGSTGVVIGRLRAIGSGFVIDRAGYILTNAHVVKGAQRVQVVLPSAGSEGTVTSSLSARGTVVPAQIVGVTQEIDLALLKVEATNLQALPIAQYKDVHQGELVFAFGSPQGLRNSVTMGVVSAVARQTDPDSPLVYIQTDAPINPGNSGGPLINVNTPPLATALSLRRNTGVIISDVLPGSPAEAVGLRIQDVLMSVDGRAADNLPIVAFVFLSKDEGEKVRIEVQRGNAQLAFDVPVVERRHDIDQFTALSDPSKNLVGPLGIVALEIDRKIALMLPELRDPYGILVVARAADAGLGVPLATGDVIRTLNGQPMTTLDRLRQALAALQPGSSVALQIQREDRLLYLAFTLEQF